MSPKTPDPSPPKSSDTPSEPTKTPDPVSESPEARLHPLWYVPDFLVPPPPRGPNDPPPKLLPIREVPQSERDRYWELMEQQNPSFKKIWEEMEDEAKATPSPKPEAPETESEC